MSRFLGSRVESILGHTEHDIYGDDVRNKFTTSESDNNKYEYIHKVNVINENATDFYFNRKKALIKVQKNTKEKNDSLKNLLKKREFTKKERLKFEGLTKKKEGLNNEELSELRNLYKILTFRPHNINEKKKFETLLKNKNGMTFKEDMEWHELFSIKFSNEREKKFRNYINGIDKIYYYTDAYKKLKRPINDINFSFVEWNSDITKSRETKWTNEVLKKNDSVTITVVKEDIVDFCIKKNKESNFVIVNTASHIKSGGSWEGGEEGSEESIFYRSTYELSLNKDKINDHFYPLVEESTIYSPRIMVYKFGRNKKYEHLPKSNNPSMLSILACCLPRYIKYKTKDKIISNECVKVYKKKIKNILQTALYWGHDSIVFDSFGCINMNITSQIMPPAHCATIFKEVIFDDIDMFYKKFKYISFCINIRNMSKIPKPVGLNDPKYYIYQDELKYHAQENTTFKTFYKILYDIDKFST